MAREDTVKKVLGSWIDKAKEMNEPPDPEDVRGTLARPERGRAYGSDGAITQLNFKIPNALKKRIKQLAIRDNITLLVMLDRMVDLYEREYGKLAKR